MLICNCIQNDAIGIDKYCYIENKPYPLAVCSSARGFFKTSAQDSDASDFRSCFHALLAALETLFLG